jgi:glycosidase
MPIEFHVSRTARDHYQFDDHLFTLTGNVIFANFHAARMFAQQMNQKRDVVNFPEQAVLASQLNAMGLIHELTHFLFKRYREQRNPNLLSDLLAALYEQVGQEAVDVTLHRFADEFPPLPVYKREVDLPTYLEGQTEGMANRLVMLEEMLMLWFSNANPAFSPFLQLFDDATLEKVTSYRQVVAVIQSFLTTQPGYGGIGETLFDVLMGPIRAAPHSLEGQLEFIRQRWASALGRYIYRLLSSLDLIKEEGRLFLVGRGAEGGGAQFYEALLHPGAGQEVEAENFSPDREWMPRLVMIAKNAYVWLDQLSKTYQRPIKTLADIPDEELDTLAQRGFTGLWLIGLWERSGASQRIKQMMGNPEAVASAYSLYDYVIANALGGEEACQNLRDRAWQRGIRLASDMVPNHVGIDGRWVVQHPDWFVSLDYSPFPVYSFNGPDLSWDERVGIYLEDHYYDRSDAAVVFKRVDRWSGREQYIYHGNDGTQMPWNDTAQLNYLLPEVREAVIQTILHVARQFPVIRFDAAMTLAKRHYQRLWFPEPGSGGDIASRADHGMTKPSFDALFPQEFWREVVDRVAAEAPDTLLLAEAFWLMESYFVRTLGMHRVYNSAFMHLLRDEDNAKFRYLIKNTLEFDPEILKRYVNFMNNPDERTAVDQFSKGDKYFGVCTLLVTMPGLPMFGHGQVEGFAEKYGMEYQRAYWEETPDGYLIERHEREIFPLHHRRYLFAGAENFLLYDFYAADGSVDENVIAYSNRFGDERGLVFYHNAFASTRGWVRVSAAYAVKTGRGDEKRLMQRTLGEGLGLRGDDNVYYIFRDQSSSLEYLRNGRELVEQGMYVELDAYKCHIFLDFREVYDHTGQYRELANYLQGRGVPSVDEALRETFLQPIHQPLRELINAAMFRRLTTAYVEQIDAAVSVEMAVDLDESQLPVVNDQLQEDEPTTDDGRRTTGDGRRTTEGEGRETDDGRRTTDDGRELALEHSEGTTDEQPELEDDRPTADHGPRTTDQIEDDVEQKMLHLLREIKAFTGLNGAEEQIAREVREELALILRLPHLENRALGGDIPEYHAALAFVTSRLTDDVALWGSLWSWLFVHALGKLASEKDFAQQSRSWIDEWLLGRVIRNALLEASVDERAATQAVIRVKRLTSQQRWFEEHDVDRLHEVIESWLNDNEVRQLLGVNRHQGVLWFNKEAFERLLWWMLLLAVVRIETDPARDADTRLDDIVACYTAIEQLRAAVERSGYQVEKLLSTAQS